MQFTRPRLTVRRLMILVALVAISLGIYQATRRWAEFRREPAKCDEDAAFQAMIADQGRKRVRKALGKHDQARADAAGYWVRVYDRRADHYRRWAEAWRDAAVRRWGAKPRPDPPPEKLAP